MRFNNPELTRRFVELCKSEDLHGTVKKTKEGWQEVTVYGFKNKTAERRFVAMWADIVLERVS